MKSFDITPTDVEYIFDGSLEGLYCCVFAAVYGGELPRSVLPEYDAQPSLWEQRFIPTQQDKADRVGESIAKKISPHAQELIETAFHSCAEDKYLKILRFMLLGYAQGARIMDMLAHRDVAPLYEARRHLMNEKHKLLGFLRFADYGETLGAVVTPKNFILPYLAEHFITRYRNESFLIYDKTHKFALVYSDRKAQLLQVEHLDFPKESEQELRYQALWKQFFRAVAVEGRENPRCQRNLCPKRYWENMLEMH